MTNLPSLVIGSGWRETLNNAFATLRRINFLIYENFIFKTFDPKLDFQGMTATNYLVRRARFLKIYKFLWLSVDVSVTLAAPFDVQMFLTIPPACIIAGNNTTDTIPRQGSSLIMQNAGVLEAGYWLGLALSNQISIQRNAGGNYTAGGARFVFNGFLEII